MLGGVVLCITGIDYSHDDMCLILSYSILGTVF
jgi:hypothetical protein